MSAKTPLLRGLFIQTELLFHTAIAALFSTMAGIALPSRAQAGTLAANTFIERKPL